MSYTLTFGMSEVAVRELIGGRNFLNLVLQWLQDFVGVREKLLQCLSWHLRKLGKKSISHFNESPTRSKQTSQQTCHFTPERFIASWQLDDAVFFQSSHIHLYVWSRRDQWRRAFSRLSSQRFSTLNTKLYVCIEVLRSVLRSLGLWIKGCVKSRAFLLRRRACFPSPSARAPASQRTILSKNTSSSV